MKSISIVLTTVAVVATGSALAIMNNACKSGQHALCAPAWEFRHHATNTGPENRWVPAGAWPMNSPGHTPPNAKQIWLLLLAAKPQFVEGQQRHYAAPAADPTLSGQAAAAAASVARS